MTYNHLLTENDEAYTLWGSGNGDGPYNYFVWYEENRDREQPAHLKAVDQENYENALRYWGKLRDHHDPGLDLVRFFDRWHTGVYMGGVPQVIDSFDDQWGWLSNFYPCHVIYCGMEFRSVEHAYQAAKCLTTDDMRRIQAASTPGKAKRLGRQVELRPDWEAVKEIVMLYLLAQKFKPNSRLGDLLRMTGSAYLMESNPYNDHHWGVCRGVGQNRLGILLMYWRSKL